MSNTWPGQRRFDRAVGYRLPELDPEPDPEKAKEILGKARLDTDRLAQALAFDDLSSYEGWVRHHYQMLPTDPRFLALRPWECKKLYMESMLRGRIADRAKKHLPVNTLADLIQDQDFDERLAELDRQEEIRATAGPQVGKSVEREILSRLGTESHG